MLGTLSNETEASNKLYRLHKPVGFDAIRTPGVVGNEQSVLSISKYFDPGSDSKFHSLSPSRGTDRLQQKSMKTNAKHRQAYARDTQVCRKSAQASDFTLKHRNEDKTENLF